MEEVYDLHQHSHLMVLYIQKTKISYDYNSTFDRNAGSSDELTEKDTFIVYDKLKTNVKSWGDKNFEGDVEDIRIDISRDKLYQVFKKDKDKWDQDDLFLLKAVSDFIRLSVEELIDEAEEELKNTDQLHYIFVVPSEWEEEIRETLLRPIFVESNLILKNDHMDRLLFCSDLESIFYLLMEDDEFDFDFTRKTILCRFVSISENEMLIKLDLVLTVNRLFDLPNSLLYPKVEHSNSFSLTVDDLTDGIKAFIKEELPLDIQEEIIQIIMDTSHGPLYDPDKEEDEEDEEDGEDDEEEDDEEEEDEEEEDEEEEDDNYLKKPLITDTSRWELDKRQKDFIESICISNICSQVCKNTTNNIDDLLSNDIIKKYNILSRVDLFSSEISLNKRLLNWSQYLLAYNRTSSRNENIIFTDNSYCEKNSSDETTEGIFRYSQEVIKNVDVYSRPHILSVKNPPTSSSIFRESKPDAIMSIGIPHAQKDDPVHSIYLLKSLYVDLSVESTILSYSLLDDNGFVKEIWNHNDFLNDKSLCSLGSFFSFSETTTTLNVKHSFIEFAKNYLMDNISFFSNDKNNVLLQLNATKFETILCLDSNTKDLWVSTRQQIYIKSFLLLYMTYIKYVISSKLSNTIDSNMEIKIGYNITVEKILLNRLFKTKEGLKDIVYASGLLQKDDISKKLRITAQGERIMHLLRRSLALTFPLKSYFVLAQLRENYVQLTLNHVVTESSSSEEDQEAIVIKDRIIQIPNLYNSLCLNMWNNIVEDGSLIKLCDKHRKYSGTDWIEIFSFKNQTEFIKNLKQYISKYNLRNNSNQPAADNIIIQLSITCNCRVYLTVCDIIDISFQPVLHDIVSLVSASFVNDELFRKFWNIRYLFQLVQFDYNTQLHDSLIKMLKETTEDVIIEQGVDIPHYLIPKSLNQLLQPVIYQRPISYKEFEVGTLHHIYGYRQGFGIVQDGPPIQLMYKSKMTDTKIISVDEETIFPLFTMGEIINDFPRNVTFYLSSQEKLDKLEFCIKCFRLEISHDLNPDGTVRFDDVQESISGTCFEGFREKLEIGQDIPISISVFYKADAGSFTLTAKVVGQDFKIDLHENIGTPMYLERL